MLHLTLMTHQQKICYLQNKSNYYIGNRRYDNGFAMLISGSFDADYIAET
jgi:hypothetical protein